MANLGDDALDERDTDHVKTARDALAAAVGTVLGIVPHVMHHIGLIAGTALITGASGNAILYAIGLLFSVPMLRRLHRRFRTRWAPSIAVALFTALFSLSAFVIGPTISGNDRDPRSPDPSRTNPVPDVTDEHHGHADPPSSPQDGSST